MRRNTMIAFLLTALGALRIVISLVTEQSDYDPTAFGIATFSILVAIIGISLAFKLPPDDKQARSGAS